MTPPGGRCPAEHAHPIALAAADETEAVMLDLIGPHRAGRHRAADRRQARLDELSWMQRVVHVVAGCWALAGALVAGRIACAARDGGPKYAWYAYATLTNWPTPYTLYLRGEGGRVQHERGR
jgi:hypothetical protein